MFSRSSCVFEVVLPPPFWIVRRTAKRPRATQTPSRMGRGCENLSKTRKTGIPTNPPPSHSAPIESRLATTA